MLPDGKLLAASDVVAISTVQSGFSCSGVGTPGEERLPDGRPMFDGRQTPLTPLPETSVALGILDLISPAEHDAGCCQTKPPIDNSVQRSRPVTNLTRVPARSAPEYT